MTYHEIILWSLRASNEDGYTLSRYYQPSTNCAREIVDANEQAGSNHRHSLNGTRVKETTVHSGKSAVTRKQSHRKAVETIQISSAATCMIQLARQSITHFRVLSLSLAQLQSLRILRLNNNCITELSPSIFELSGLEELDLSNNQLRRLPPGISKLKRLDNLKLRDNQLESIPQELAHLADLYTLDISNNQLVTLPAELNQQPQLTRFWFENNLFNDPPLDNYYDRNNINVTNDATNDADTTILNDWRCPNWLRQFQTTVDPYDDTTVSNMMTTTNDSIVSAFSATDIVLDLLMSNDTAHHGWWPGLSVSFDSHLLVRQKRKVRGVYRMPFKVEASNYGLYAKCLQLIGERSAASTTSTTSDQVDYPSNNLHRLPLKLRNQLTSNETTTSGNANINNNATCWQCRTRLYHNTLSIIIWQKTQYVFVPWQLQFCRLSCLLKVHGKLCTMIREEQRIRIQLLRS